MAEIEVRMNELHLKIACDEQHRWFWDQVADNRWEVETLQAFDQCIRCDTLYIDVGTWIGPTVLYAGSKARSVIAVEPDPVAMTALMRNLDLNPAIREKVVLHNHALARESGRLDLWAYRFGDSMTSVLPTRGAQRLTFLSMGVDTFLNSALEGGEENVFIKIDVEGGEYTLVPALCDSLRRRGVRANLYVSLHASFLVDKECSAKSYTAALLENARLLQSLVEYGTVHSYEGGAWCALENNFGQAKFFDDFRKNGGADTTLLVIVS